MRYFLILILFAGNITFAQTPVAHYITVADSKMYIEESGHGDAVILLHAGNCDHRMWDKQTIEFNKYFRVINCDLRGCGLTQDSDSTYLQSDALLAMMDTLKIKTASFVGLSLGSVAATAFALAHPERVDKLVLASPGLIGINMNHDAALIKYAQDVENANAKKDTMALAEAFVKTWVDGPSRKPEEVDKEVRKKALNMVYQNMAKRKTNVHPGFLYQPAQLKQLPGLKKKILVIVGKKDIRDILLIADEFKRNGAKLVFFSTSAHLVNMEQPNEFNKQVLKFLGYKLIEK